LCLQKFIKLQICKIWSPAKNRVAGHQNTSRAPPIVLELFKIWWWQSYINRRFETCQNSKLCSRASAA
jgi:hypothetical protein